MSAFLMAAGVVAFAGDLSTLAEMGIIAVKREGRLRRYVLNPSFRSLRQSRTEPELRGICKICNPWTKLSEIREPAPDHDSSIRTIADSRYGSRTPPVILAGIAASMIFGIGFPESAFVAVTAVRSGETIAFTNHGGMNMDRAVEIRCWIGGTGPGDENFTLEARAGAFETRVVPDAARVVVVGRFEDNESWILVDETL